MVGNEITSVHDAAATSAALPTASMHRGMKQKILFKESAVMA